jgi:hypothetical protein
MKRLDIRRAIKKPGSLRAAARRAGAVTGKGRINTAWLNKQARRKGKMGARARFARTLSRMRKHRR